MKVFISHSESDEHLARMLKTTLESRKEINEAFIFEDKRKYGIEITKKITDEIDQSDYLVAIITQTTKESASVHQELGYAQAKDIEKIPMVENGSKEGFMVYATENVYFSSDDFNEKCLKVRDYIMKNGSKRPFTKEEESIVQKSAHYRQEVENAIIEFLDSIFYRLNIGTEQERALIMFGKPEKIKKGLKLIHTFFNKEPTELVSHFLKISFSTYTKLHFEYEEFIKELKDADRFPNYELFQDESDALIKLKENMASLSAHDLNLEQHVRLSLPPNVDFAFENCLQVINLKDYHTNLQQYLRFVIFDLKKVVFSMISLIEIFMKYKEKFGEIAFKTIYD